MAKGNKPVPPVANQTQPGGAKHVPSSVAEADVRDASVRIHSHIDASQDHVSQDPQTVGGNPNSPDQQQASEEVSALPRTAGAPGRFLPYSGWR